MDGSVRHLDIALAGHDRTVEAHIGPLDPRSAVADDSGASMKAHAGSA